MTLSQTANPQSTNFIRLSGDADSLVTTLGPLAHLVGTWFGGQGWNIIAVPQGDTFSLLVRPYIEQLSFTPVGAAVPNRGSMGTMMVYGLEYDLRITDGETNQPLHVESGMWLYWGENPGGAPTLARQATIPHGVSALALGTSTTITGAPAIPDNTAVPDAGAALAGYLDQYLNSPVTGVSLQNPNNNLQDAITGLDIVQTTILDVSTAIPGSIGAIPFVTSQANTSQFQATYWIELVEVQNKTGGAATRYEQLQYSQQTNINFLHYFGDPNPNHLIMWPHININTLFKQ